MKTDALLVALDGGPPETVLPNVTATEGLMAARVIRKMTDLLQELGLDAAQTALVQTLNVTTNALLASWTPALAGLPAPLLSPVPAELPLRRALLVEDNFVNQVLATKLLRQLQWHAEVAVNGEEAIRKVQEQPYELVLMDCHMPVMDGFAATAAIRALPAPWARVPIIAMTARAMVGDRERCLEAGMDDYVCKPVIIKHLEAALERWAPHLPAVALPPSPPAYCLEEALELMAGDAQMLALLADSFRQTGPPMRRRLESALTRRHTEDLQNAAHALKGSAAIFAAGPLVGLAQTLEQSAEGQDWERLQAVGLESLREFDRLLEALAPLSHRRS